MIEARVERPGYVYLGKPIPKGQRIVVTRDEYARSGAPGEGILSFVRMVGSQPDGPSRVQTAGPESYNATPGAIALAQEEGVDLADVEGSGSGGRITKADVEQAASSES